MDIVRPLTKMALYLGAAVAVSIFVLSVVMWAYTWLRGGRG
jgi:hypothetical protein